VKGRGGITAALVFSTALVTAAETIDVNRATLADLMKLPEVTEARAKAILAYRQGNGELIQLEELKLIPQVAPIYDRIKDKLTVE
jgi:DNA uptake protein ComE-like DNA-binding protein